MKLERESDPHAGVSMHKTAGTSVNGMWKQQRDF